MAQFANGLLVNSDWLKERINTKNLVIFHIGKEEDYLKEHIPGARFIDWQEYTFNDDTHDFDLPTVKELQNMLESKGLSDGDTVVIYTGESWISLMTRLYFTLDYLGYGDHTFMLNGGLVKWKENGGDVTSEVVDIRKGNFTPHPQKQLIASKEYVLKNLNKSHVNIVDGRATVFYEGIEAGNGGKSRKGHIPGAKSIPFTSLSEPGGEGYYQFKSVDDIQKIFDEQGVKKQDQLLLYCHIGMQLTTVYAAAKMLGFKNIKVYDGSFYEWGPDESLPIALEN